MISRPANTSSNAVATKGKIASRPARKVRETCEPREVFACEKEDLEDGGAMALDYMTRLPCNAAFLPEKQIIARKHRGS
jgi:hypothetical protein